MKNSVRTGLIIIGAVLFFVVIMAFWLFGTYNSLVTLSESVTLSWSQVENQYQRRADLIPNLIATVQGAADFEKNTQTQIAALRTQAVSAKTAWSNANTVDEKIAAAQQVDSVVSGFRALNINVENYPQLKATQNFETFQAQLEGTENRIAVERMRYNDAVKVYNIKVKRIPSSFVASMFGFNEKNYFEVEEGKAGAPLVQFQ
jgi:LemA protein